MTHGALRYFAEKKTLHDCVRCCSELRTYYGSRKWQLLHNNDDPCWPLSFPLTLLPTSPNFISANKMFHEICTPFAPSLYLTLLYSIDGNLKEQSHWLNLQSSNLFHTRQFTSSDLASKIIQISVMGMIRIRFGSKAIILSSFISGQWKSSISFSLDWHLFAQVISWNGS